MEYRKGCIFQEQNGVVEGIRQRRITELPGEREIFYSSFRQVGEKRQGRSFAPGMSQPVQLFMLRRRHGLK